MDQGRDVVERTHRFKPSGDSAFYEHTIVTCWSTSNEKMKLEKEYPMPILLDLMMFLDIEGESTTDTSPNLKSLTQPLNLVETVGILLKYSLLQWITITIHFLSIKLNDAVIYEQMS